MFPGLAIGSGQRWHGLGRIDVCLITLPQALDSLLASACGVHWFESCGMLTPNKAACPAIPHLANLGQRCFVR